MAAQGFDSQADSSMAGCFPSGCSDWTGLSSHRPHVQFSHSLLEAGVLQLLHIMKKSNAIKYCRRKIWNKVIGKYIFKIHIISFPHSVVCHNVGLKLP